MTLVEYQNRALKRLNPNISKLDKEGMRFCCMGILEETGEIVSELRKTLFKGNFHEKPLNKEEIKSEIGDLLWYMALACRNNEIDMESLSNYSQDKKYVGSEDRDKIINVSLKLGKQSGIIVKRYLQYYNEKGEVQR